MMLKYSWESQMLEVKRLGVRGALPKLGGACSYLLSIRVTYETRDQHMLKRLQAGRALGVLCHVTVHFNNYENTKLDTLSTTIQLQFY